MNHEKELYRSASRNAQSEQEMARRKKWDERGKKFWSAFLFTKDGKPKSGYGIYTFCLAVLFLFMYGGAYVASIGVMHPVIGGLPVLLENLIESALATAVSLAVVFILHKLLEDKRLMLGAHIWLDAIAVACVISMLIFLKGSGAYATLFNLIFWYIFIPLGCGTILSAWLCKRDYHPKQEAEAEPAWKKYIRRD